MSTEDMQERIWKEWIPDEPQQIFFQERRNGSQVEELLLTSAEISSTPSGEDFEWKLTFLCDKDSYFRMEQERWFAIPVGFANWYEANFHDHISIQVSIAFHEWNMLDLMYSLPSTDLLVCLEHMLRPLTDRAFYSLPCCSLAYKVIDVRQIISEEEIIGFSADTISNAGF